jgi:uncharacterized protein YkwD
LRPSSTRADRALRAALLGLACALLALLPAALPAPAAAAPGFAHALLRELNRARAHHRLPPVHEDPRMDHGAHGHSRDMAQRGYFAHGSWSGRVLAAAVRARTVGEAIGWRVQSSPSDEAAAMVRAWLASPPHRLLLLDRDFARVGIGRATASQNGRAIALYTLDFASRG